MAEEPNGAGAGTGSSQDPNPNPNPKDADEMVSIKKSELDNYQKSRDDEREARKRSDAALAQRLADEEKLKTDAERQKAEAKGEYDKLSNDLKAENETLKQKAERLTKLEETTDAKNVEDLKLFKDEDDLSLVQSAIAGKDAFEAREIIKKFKAKFLKADGKGNFGGKTKPNPDDAEVKSEEIKTLQAEFDALLDKKRKKENMSPQDIEQLRVLPRKIQKIKDGLKVDKKD